jgi:5-deoxy-D-glucuronate isomerase
MLIWRTQSKKINSSSNIDLTRTSAVVVTVVSGEAVILMVAEDVEVEVVGTRMAVVGTRMAVLEVEGTRMAVSEVEGTRMAVVEVVVGTRMAVAEAVTAEAGVVAILTTAIRVEAHREVAMDILGEWS